MNDEFETNEGLRKFLHIVFGLFAVALKYIPWRVAAIVAAVAVIANWLLLHRLVGKRVARHARGYDPGIVLYPAAVLALILIFNWHIEIAAAAWVIMAFGDGFATLLGKAVPLARLPWNRDKSAGGTIAFLLFGGAAAFAMARIFGGPPPLALAVAIVTAAIAESLPLRLNDNVVVPATAAGVLAAFAVQPLVSWSAIPPIPWPWIALNTILAVVGYLIRSVDLSGLVAGWFLGCVVIVGGGPAMYVALLTFFIIGTASTKLGYARKSAAGLAQEKGGRRGAGHAIANVGVAALCAVACWRGLGLVPLFMGITALATAAADTTGSEIGKLFGKRAFHPLRFKRVPPGTDGAVSLAGTLAGIVAAFLVAAAGTAMAANRLRPGFTGSVVIAKSHVIAVITTAAFLGSYVESILGSFEVDIPNDVMNFINTMVGALLFWIAWNYVPMFGWEF
ncbi:MAG: DUF92 domain-containing protein [Acidobacteriota bacterium]